MLQGKSYENLSNTMAKKKRKYTHSFDVVVVALVTFFSFIFVFFFLCLIVNKFCSKSQRNRQKKSRLFFLIARFLIILRAFYSKWNKMCLGLGLMYSMLSLAIILRSANDNSQKFSMIPG